MNYLIENVTDAADQVLVLQMPDGSEGQLELIFTATTKRWVFNFTHVDFPNGSINGQMLCLHPNILRNFKNVLDFGMACASVYNVDPISIESFASGVSQLYILDAEDVEAVEQGVFGEFALTEP